MNRLFYNFLAVPLGTSDKIGTLFKPSVYSNLSSIFFFFSSVEAKIDHCFDAKLELAVCFFIDIDLAHLVHFLGYHFPLQDTVSSSEDISAKTRSVIELKKLQLLQLQRRLRK